MAGQVYKELTHIVTAGNCLSVRGPYGVAEFHRLLAAIHDRVVNRGYSDLVLEFSDCTSAFAGPMLALCAQVVKMRAEGIGAALVLPSDLKLQKLFKNANWAHHIDPERFEVSKFKGSSQVPALHFVTANDQDRSVNTIMNAVLGSLSDFTREDLAAIEWSVNEITDNVINHSESATGGFVQLSTFKKQQRRVEYVVCDAGIGIPGSLRHTYPQLTSDTEALDKAIREGVTRDLSVGMGNGLFGTFEICRVSKGYFEVHSGYARLTQNEPKGLHIGTEKVPYAGTLVVACVDYSSSGVLSEALKFKGRRHDPTVDYIETNFESKDGKRVVFLMNREAPSFGSRQAAKPVKTKLQTLAALCPNQKVYIDFADVPVVSSSFADEVFGRLFLELGPITFMQRFEIVNTSDTVRSLINRAIAQRTAMGR